MLEKNDDHDWLEALAGKQLSNSNQTAAQATMLRKAIQRHNKQLLGENYDISAELEKLNKRLMVEGATPSPAENVSIKKRWGAFIAAILTAFAFGAMVMRFTMMPAMEGVRSSGEILSAPATAHTQRVPVFVKSPSETMQAAVGEAARIDINFHVKVAESGYDLTVFGFVAHSAKQEALKTTLGLSKSAAGDTLLEIRKKE